MLRLGVVSFLNSRPLVEGLEERPDVRCTFAVPAALPPLLDAGDVDVALVPIIDVLRAGERYRVVSDSCIAADGETMTVRVFAQVPPDRVRALRVDPDSHTSVALARVLWRHLFDRDLQLRPLQPAPDAPDEAVLLIGDKVVDPGRAGFGYEVDLGGAWRQLTGLPFVFAVWARPTAAPSAADFAPGDVAALLEAARDRGVARAVEIAERDGPARGWPIELARRYLTRCLCFRLDTRAVEGATLFARWCAELGMLDDLKPVTWPDKLASRAGAATP